MQSILVVSQNTAGVWEPCLSGCHGVQVHLCMSGSKLKMWEAGWLAQDCMGSALGPKLSISKVLEHAQPFGHWNLKRKVIQLDKCGKSVRIHTPLSFPYKIFDPYQ